MNNSEFHQVQGQQVSMISLLKIEAKSLLSICRPSEFISALYWRVFSIKICFLALPTRYRTIMRSKGIADFSFAFYLSSYKCVLTVVLNESEFYHWFFWFGFTWKWSFPIFSFLDLRHVIICDVLFYYRSSQLSVVVTLENSFASFSYSCVITFGTFNISSWLASF